MDLAPTFLEAAGLQPLDGMAAKSLMPILETDADGEPILADPTRDHVVLGRERHVAKARPGSLPYPQRALRTERYLYIRNFEPTRWPMGDPKGLDDPNAEPPSYEELSENTFIAYPDLDASPTKAWMVHNRAKPETKRLFEMGFGKFPAEELYDLSADPHYMNNIAGSADYAEAQRRLSERLDNILREQNDPRVAENPCRFERPPFAGDP